jgi:hypothetical protein
MNFGGKWSILTVLLFVGSTGLSASGVSFHGRIIKPDNSPLESPNTRFRIQIKSPGSESCLLWEEEQTRNMLGSNGTFTITIGDSSDTTINYSRVDTYAWGIDRVFSNRSQFTSLVGCTVGNLYLPNAADGRILEVSFKEAPTDPNWEAFPATKINLVPMSFNSLQLEGYRADEFLKIEPYPNQVSISNVGVNSLLAIIAGNSNLYSKPSDPLGGDLTGTVGAGTVIGIRGRGITNAVPAPGQVLKFDGTSWVPSNDATGTDDITKLPLAGGTMSGSINMGLQNITNVTSVAATNLSARNLLLNDNDADVATLRAPPNLVDDYTLTLPTAAPINGYVLSTDATGQLLWIPAATGSVTGTGTTNSIPKFTAAGTISDSAIVDDGVTITASRSIVTTTNPIATGSVIDLATSNTHTLTLLGGDVITVQNMSNGGVYNIVIEDPTSRTYTFNGCTSTYFKPTNAATAVGTRTIYGLMTIRKGSNWDCYVTWSTGFQ